MHDNVFVELKTTIHYTNRSGVRAVCSNCHVPHDWTDKMARKMQASKEVWGKIFGTINTQEKFRDKRLELAQHEWARFKANDSLECRNCHNYEFMDFTRQSIRAQNMHSTYLANKEKTCIDCHKGIAHRLPISRPAKRRLTPRVKWFPWVRVRCSLLRWVARLVLQRIELAPRFAGIHMLRA
jgi:cytochrome c-type protein NapC